MFLFTQMRFTVRQLWKMPAGSGLAIVAMALGIGVVTAQFSFVNGVVLKGLPFPQGDRVICIGRVNPGWPGVVGTPARDYLAWCEQQQSCEGLGAIAAAPVNLSAAGLAPQRYRGAQISANVPALLRVQPLRGRAFAAEDDRAGARAVVLLGERVWRRDFGMREDVVGQEIQVNGEAATIVGVMPALFQIPFKEEVWTNLRLRTTAPESDPTRVQVIGRLKAGTTVTKAGAEFNTFVERLAQQWPENREFRRARVAPYVAYHQDADAAPVLLTMLGMVLGVLLVACANVATLLLARAARRTKELAVRTALGATRQRLVFELVGESLVIAGAGALGGVLLAAWGTRLLQVAIESSSNPFWWDVTLDGRVLVFAVVCTLVAGVGSGALPAWQATRSDVNSALKDETLATSSLRLGRFNRYLVPLQLAVSCALLVLTLLMGKTVVDAKQAALPFSAEHLILAKIDLLDTTRFGTPESRAEFYARLVEHLRRLPGIEALSVSSRDPLSFAFRCPTEIEGTSAGAGPAPAAMALEVVAAGHFHTLGVPLIKGREFEDGDRMRSEPVAVVNATLARMVWPDQDPVGKRLRWQGDAEWATVVGVVPDLRMNGALQRGEAAGVYLPQGQKGWGNMSVIARASGDPIALAPSLRRALADFAPDQAVYDLHTMSQGIDAQMEGARVLARVFAVFGGLAMLLATVGTYGLTSFSVAQRTREFGVRLALGAPVAAVRRIILGQVLRFLGIGAGVGLGLALAARRLITAVLGEQSAGMPLVVALVLVVLAVSTCLAAWLPAWRAGRIEPVNALRSE